jgi:hypothetical protein
LVSYLPKADDQKCGQVTYGIPYDRKMGQAIGRVDYQVSQRHAMFGRYMATFDQSPSPFATTDNILTLAGSNSPSLPGASVRQPGAVCDRRHDDGAWREFRERLYASPSTARRSIAALRRFSIRLTSA